MPHLPHRQPRHRLPHPLPCRTCRTGSVEASLAGASDKTKREAAEVRFDVYKPDAKKEGLGEKNNKEGATLLGSTIITLESLLAAKEQELELLVIANMPQATGGGAAATEASRRATLDASESAPALDQELSKGGEAGGGAEDEENKADAEKGPRQVGRRPRTWRTPTPCTFH